MLSILSRVPHFGSSLLSAFLLYLWTSPLLILVSLVEFAAGLTSATEFQLLFQFSGQSSNLQLLHFLLPAVVFLLQQPDCFVLPEQGVFQPFLAGLCSSFKPFSSEFTAAVCAQLCQVSRMRGLASFAALLQAFSAPAWGLFCACLGSVPPPFKPFFRLDSSSYTLSLSSVPAGAAGLLFLVLGDQLLHLGRTYRFAWLVFAFQSVSAFSATTLSLSLLLISVVVWWELREFAAMFSFFPLELGLLLCLASFLGSYCRCRTVFMVLGKEPTCCTV
ncbi:hypothetical protein Salat_0718900 [Sesamum alatum]|uniref:Uncharacterized protein n=1 Tax=Sesamum alatum TaxID=300844 RepID=A0AAE1YS99_9LAMI|nr:hypothetical protein Salat_0718900 [Sesamum alatum]